MEQAKARAEGEAQGRLLKGEGAQKVGKRRSRAATNSHLQTCHPRFHPLQSTAHFPSTASHTSRLFAQQQTGNKGNKNLIVPLITHVSLRPPLWTPTPLPCCKLRWPLGYNDRHNPAHPPLLTLLTNTHFQPAL